VEGGLEESSLAKPKVPVNQRQAIPKQDASRLDAAPADVVFVIVLQDIFDVVGIRDQ
jgi:hypothetical protein